MFHTPFTKKLRQSYKLSLTTHKKPSFSVAVKEIFYNCHNFLVENIRNLWKLWVLCRSHALCVKFSRTYIYFLCVNFANSPKIIFKFVDNFIYFMVGSTQAYLNKCKSSGQRTGKSIVQCVKYKLKKKSIKIANKEYKLIEFIKMHLFCIWNSLKLKI